MRVIKTSPVQPILSLVPTHVLPIPPPVLPIPSSTSPIPSLKPPITSLKPPIPPPPQPSVPQPAVATTVKTNENGNSLRLQFASQLLEAIFLWKLFLLQMKQRGLGSGTRVNAASAVTWL